MLNILNILVNTQTFFNKIQTFYMLPSNNIFFIKLRNIKKVELKKNMYKYLTFQFFKEKL